MRIVFREFPTQVSDAPAPGELHVRAPDPKAAEGRVGLTSKALREGPAGFPTGVGPVEYIVVQADPTLDDMLAARVLQEQSEGTKFPADVPLAHYAAALARGHHPAEGMPAEELIEGVFAHYRHAANGPLTDPGLAAKFLADWAKLASLLRPALLDAGINPFRQSLLAGRVDFREECLYLRNDRNVYKQDVRNGERWHIALPKTVGEFPALRLREPKSVLFKFWARSDPDAVGAPVEKLGYHFLAVLWGENDWWFTTDPLDRYDIRSLAAEFQAVEVKKNPGRVGPDGKDPDPWYNGHHHNFTIVRPPHGSTALTTAEVWDVVVKWGQARRVIDSEPGPRFAATPEPRPVPRSPRSKRWGVRAAALLAFISAVGFGGWYLFPPPPPPPEEQNLFVRSDVVRLWRDPSSLQDKPDGSRTRGFKPTPGNRQEFQLEPRDGPDRPLLIWLVADQEPPKGITIKPPGGTADAVPGWTKQKDGQWRSPPLHCPLKGGALTVTVEVPNLAANLDLSLAWRTNPHVVHLHVMTVGVSEYGTQAGPTVTSLAYAAADAKDLASAFKRLEGPLFTEVLVLDPLVAELKSAGGIKPTAEGVRQQLKRFRKQVIDDKTPLKLAVIAFSGHGAIYDDRHFFFLPSDYDPAVLSTHVYWSDFETHLGDLGCNTVLLLDACHSGQAALRIAFTGGKSVPNDEALGEAITDFGKEKPGLFVLAAADSGGTAWENKKYGHGAMTQAVLEVLRGEAPRPAGGVFTLEDMLGHARKRVQEMGDEERKKQRLVPGFAPGRRPDAIPIAYFPPPPPKP